MKIQSPSTISNKADSSMSSAPPTSDLELADQKNRVGLANTFKDDLTHGDGLEWIVVNRIELPSSF